MEVEISEGQSWCLKEGEYSCYGDGQFKGTMFVTEVACLMEGK